MNLKRFFITTGVLLPLCHSISGHANDEDNLANEVETPDVLLQETDTKAKQAQYGDDDIKLTPKGKGDTSQVTPDPLEKNLMPETDDTKAEDKKAEESSQKKKKPEKKKPAEKKAEKKAEPSNDDITTPDPLLDMIN